MKKILSIFVFIILIIIILYSISPIFVPKWTKGDDNHITQIVRGFYAEKDNSLDVLFMGNSDMYRGISPIILWDEYGIASYAYTSPGQRLWTGYYVLLDALRSQHPDIIFFNIDGIQSTNQSTESCYRKAFDNMQLSSVKLKAINDPVYNFSYKTKLSYLFPIFRFHSRFSDLSSDDFKYAYGYDTYSEKGYDMIVEIDGYADDDKYMEEKDETYTLPDTTTKYLNKIVEKCEKEKITLILVEIPSADSWSLAKSKAVEEFANENNLEFIDFNLLLDDLDFDWTNDTCDGGDHLNIYGAEKVSKYIGKYLNDNFDLPDRRDDSNYKSWFDASKEYQNNKEQLINDYKKNKHQED